MMTGAVNTSTGQAIFSGLSIDKAGTGYTLTATGSTVSATSGVVVSGAFNKIGRASWRERVKISAGDGIAGKNFGTEPVVTVQEAGGNTGTGTAQNVKVAIHNNAG